MRYLLDTHVLLWVLADPERIPAAIRAELASSGNAVFVSVASLWEIAIKRALQKEEFLIEPDEIHRALIPSGLVETAISAAHVLEVAKLPPLHRDPFDRLLVATARVDGLVLVTRDRALPAYNVGVLRLP